MRRIRAGLARHQDFEAAIHRRLFYYPRIWVFYRGPIWSEDRRVQQAGAHCRPPAPDSGNAPDCLMLSRANGVTRRELHIHRPDFPADATFDRRRRPTRVCALAPGSKKVQDLLLAPAHSADCISSAERTPTSRAFPLSVEARHVPRSVEFEPYIPSADITLLASAPGSWCAGIFIPRW